MELLLKKVAIAVDQRTGDHFNVFEVRKITGAIDLEHVRADQVDDMRLFRRELVKKGMLVPMEASAAKALFERARQEPPPEIWHYVAQMGWQDNDDVFMLGKRAIGSSSTIYKTAPWRDARASAKIAKLGTLQAWKGCVASPAIHSSVMMALMATPFAACLLRRVGAPNFLVNVFGPAKSGKSTALLAATSVLGLGSEQSLPNWNATQLGLQETALDFNDMVLPANEVGLITGPKVSAYDTFVRPLICGFAEGASRVRSSAAQHVETHARQDWRGILISTAENSFESLATRGGLIRQPGERARSLEISATRRTRPTIVDQFPTKLQRSKRRAWALKFLRKMREACEQEHGTAIGPFLEHVIQTGRPAVTAFVNERITAFMNAVGADELAPGLEHAARNFAMIYAGGALAIEAGVVPWKRKALRSAVLKCFHSTEDITRLQDPLAAAKKSCVRG